MNRFETKTVYTFDESMVYTGELVLTWKNRLENSGTWIMPTFSTNIAPPKPKDGFQRIYDFVNHTWIYKEIPKTEDELKEERLTALDNEYEDAVKNLSLSFVNAVMSNDEDAQTSLKEDLIALNENYDAQRVEIERG